MATFDSRAHEQRAREENHVMDDAEKVAFETEVVSLVARVREGEMLTSAAFSGELVKFFAARVLISDPKVRGYRTFLNLLYKFLVRMERGELDKAEQVIALMRDRANFYEHVAECELYALFAIGWRRMVLSAYVETSAMSGGEIFRWLKKFLGHVGRLICVFRERRDPENEIRAWALACDAVYVIRGQLLFGAYQGERVFDDGNRLAFVAGSRRIADRIHELHAQLVQKISGYADSPDGKRMLDRCYLLRDLLGDPTPDDMERFGELFAELP